MAALARHGRRASGQKRFCPLFIKSVPKGLIRPQKSFCIFPCMGTVSPIQKPDGERQPTTPALAYTPGVAPERCVIVQSMQEGACVSALSELPDVFILRQIDSRVERMCRVIWREGGLIGVQYVNMRLARLEGPAHQFDWSVMGLFPS
jgi:hypothetical protein